MALMVMSSLYLFLPLLLNCTILYTSCVIEFFLDSNKILIYQNNINNKNTDNNHNNNNSSGDDSQSSAIHV